MVAVDLQSLARRLPSRPVTRFAPSPTGYLHLGHVANAVYVWGIAGALDGRVLLRLEDHDRLRCWPEYESALLEDLDKLSKASGDTGIRELRRQGVAPGAILGQAAYLSGLLATPRELRPGDLAGLVSAG
jgi:hypothetical protein